MKLTKLLTAGYLSIFMAGALLAQTTNIPPEINQEIRRLRQDLTDLQRKIYANPSASGGGNSGVNAGANDSALSAMQAKIQSYDNVIRSLTGKLEEFDNKLEQIDRKYSGFINGNEIKYRALEEKLKSYDNLFDRINKIEASANYSKEATNNLIAAQEELKNSVTHLESLIPPPNSAAATNLGTIKSPTPPKKPSNVAFTEAYNLVLDKKHPEAIDALIKFIDDYPESVETPNAKFWLAREYYVTKKYGNAGEIYYDIYQNYPKFIKRFQAMYELGITLKNAKAKTDACSIFTILVQKHEKEAEKSIIEQAKKEITTLECGS